MGQNISLSRIGSHLLRPVRHVVQSRRFVRRLFPLNLFATEWDPSNAVARWRTVASLTTTEKDLQSADAVQITD